MSAIPIYSVLNARRQPRLALPVLRTADLLITQCFADPEEDDPADDVNGTGATASAAEQRLLALVQAIRREARGSADLARLTAAASALCHAAARGAAVRAAALPPVLAILVSRYPKARLIVVAARYFLSHCTANQDMEAHPSVSRHCKV